MTTTTNECEAKTCSYYDFYLAQSKAGEPDLTHEAFHAVEAACLRAQEALTAWMEAHPDDDPVKDPRGLYLWRRAEALERTMRA